MIALLCEGDLLLASIYGPRNRIMKVIGKVFAFAVSNNSSSDALCTFPLRGSNFSTLFTRMEISFGYVSEHDAASWIFLQRASYSCHVVYLLKLKLNA